MFKVLKIISDKRIVVNAGDSHVAIGDRLAVISEETAGVWDNGVFLGELHAIKDIAAVESVYAKMCVCVKTSELMSFNLSAFNVDPKEITGGYVARDRTIRIGDEVEYFAAKGGSIGRKEFNS